jgi:crotonobetainyl-CoA:carnitine CoA-transferase CaiB-like acyl-CoA transferase
MTQPPGRGEANSRRVVLDSIRVVDLSSDVAGAYASKLLASFGADVIKVEPSTGDPTRWMPPRRGEGPDAGILFAYLNAGKRSVVLDLDDARQRLDLTRLIETSDVVFDSSAPGQLAYGGVDLARLCEEQQRLVVCSITPFGQDGPRSGWRATSLTAFAAGGQMMLCGDPDRPPLMTAGHQAYYQAGLHGFSSTMSALYAVRRGGRGDRIDISIQEAQAAALAWQGATAMVHGTDQGRSGDQSRAMWSTYQCKDGYVGLAAMARQAASVYECIGHPELAADPSLSGLVGGEHDALVAGLITEWAMAHTAREIYERSAHTRAPFALIQTPRELLEWGPLVESGFWHEIDHPVLGQHMLPATSVEIAGTRGEQRRAPLLGEHTEEVLRELATYEARSTAEAASDASASPLLDGVRVLDLTQIWAGPSAARFFADMGADVIHIEGPGFPDAVRSVAVSDPDAPRPYNRSPYFNEYNRNKRGLALDLAHPDGLAAFMRLVKRADVVIENWSAGVASRLGVDHEALKEVNPRIIAVSMPGFGRIGSDAGRVGFGPSLEQMGGLVALQGYEGGPPHSSGVSYGDPVAGTIAAGATALALFRRENTGDGCSVVVSQRDTVLGLIGEYAVAESLGCPLPARVGNRDPQLAPHNVYRGRDSQPRPVAGQRADTVHQLSDSWLAVAVEDDAAWRALLTVVDDSRLRRRELATAEGRRAAAEAIDEVIGSWAAGREPNEAAAELQAAGVAAAPVLSPLMLVWDQHLAARGFYSTYDHADAGTCRTTRPVWRLARRPFQDLRPAPRFGEHNREILADLAGLGEREIAVLEQTGVVATEPA